MITLTPNGSPAETASAYGLLAIIADPAAAKARLDELAAEKKAALELHDNARMASEQAAANEAAASEKLAAAQKIIDDFNATHELRSKQLDDHSAFLGTKQKQLEEQEAALTAHEAEKSAELTAREEAVRMREIDVTERETVAMRVGHEAQMLKETYERKVNALQAALSPSVDYVMPAETGALGAAMGPA